MTASTVFRWSEGLAPLYYQTCDWSFPRNNDVRLRTGVFGREIRAILVVIYNVSRLYLQGVDWGCGRAFLGEKSELFYP